jgi:hypothetical protein
MSFRELHITIPQCERKMNTTEISDRMAWVAKELFSDSILQLSSESAPDYAAVSAILTVNPDNWTGTWQLEMSLDDWVGEDSCDIFTETSYFETMNNIMHLLIVWPAREFNTYQND